MGKITIYSAPECPFSAMARKHLDDRRVPYDDIDVSRSHGGIWDVMDKTGQTGVPVIIVEEGCSETVLTGYNAIRLDDALNPFYGDRKMLI